MTKICGPVFVMENIMDKGTAGEISAISCNANEEIIVLNTDDKCSTSYTATPNENARKFGDIDRNCSPQTKSIFKLQSPIAISIYTTTSTGRPTSSDLIDIQENNPSKISPLDEMTRPTQNDFSHKSSEISVSGRIVSMRDGESCLVKAAPTLQIECSRETGIRDYRSFVLTIVTASKHHPTHGCPYSKKDVKLTFDCSQKMVILQVPYIENGIYEVLPKGELSPHEGFRNAFVQQTQLLSRETINDMAKGSTYIIIGQIYQIPTNVKLESRFVWKKIIHDFVGSIKFREFTLPLLLAYGEQNVWTDLPGCQDVEPVFLAPKLDYDSWKWCQGIHIPEMNPTRRSNNIPIEPSTIPTTLPFCEFIYHTYIAGTPWQKDECEQSEDDIDENKTSANNPITVNKDQCEFQFKRPCLLPPKTLLKIQKARKVSEEKKRDRCRNKRLLVNVNSLCSSSPPINYVSDVNPKHTKL